MDHEAMIDQCVICKKTGYTNEFFHYKKIIFCRTHAKDMLQAVRNYVQGIKSK
jgi:hypothetical protein